MNLEAMEEEANRGARNAKKVAKAKSSPIFR